MKAQVLASLLALAGGLVGQNAAGMPVIVAGSHLNSSPPFMQDSFWGVTSNIDRAFPFEVIDGGPWKLSALNVAAYRYPNSVVGATSAQFSIHVDQNGVPGSSIATFALNEIPLVAQIHSLVPLEGTVVVLYPDTHYWVLGGTTRGQLNWNLSDFTSGPAAYHVDGEGWFHLSSTNISAFAILAVPVPEPAGLLLVAGAALTAVVLYRQRVPTF